ncbi:MAG: CidA/LrgA family protein [Desulfovibrio sp.]|nr:CidA/LrgA family protein [Desulfovibrio sp.]
MQQTLIFFCQLGALAAFAWTADQVVKICGLPIPGNVLGIIVLFTLLCTGIVKESHISAAAGFLLRHLVFFFVPVAVGLMNWGGVFYDYGWALLAAIVVSAALPLLVVSKLARALRHRPGQGGERQKEEKPCGQ